MSLFELHPQLAADTLRLGHLELCELLLMNDTSYPWLILVPKVNDVREIHALPPGDQQKLMEEITFVSRRLERLTNADKMNVAALGNMVPQLHVHVIARFETDPAWPGPVWGKAPAAPYGDEQKMAMLASLNAVLEF
ncbi:MAG: HIT family protein [Kordiimonadaceae bacterium]|nr:HIT family protein [Kordiimonadaceae bacterium]MBO6568210.1 HIT family protein [Kordiimonadaceae bacterium]MBO6964060.1 HIT family protein [Kordiimonadaceae bacterium]